MLRKAFLDKGKLAHFAAAQFVTQAQRAVAQRGQFLAAISGGGTPAPLYDLLAHEPYKQQVPWSQTHIFWGDERCVLPDQPGSNYKQAKEALLDLVPLSDKKIYRIHGELDPQDAAQEYADQLLVFASGGYRWPQFDLVLLGMGLTVTRLLSFRVLHQRAINRRWRLQHNIKGGQRTGLH